MALKNGLHTPRFGEPMSEEVEEGMFTAVGDPENPDLVESKIEGNKPAEVVEEWKPSNNKNQIRQRKRYKTTGKRKKPKVNFVLI